MCTENATRDVADTGFVPTSRPTAVPFPRLSLWAAVLSACLAVLPALLMPAGAGAATSATVAGPPATVVSETRVGPRLVDLLVSSPAMGREVPVRLLTPQGWENRTHGQRWPVLYLLHGRTQSYTGWTENTDVENLPELRGALVVMPDAGPVGWYSDWWNGGVGGPPAWETFHLTELRRLLEDEYGASGSRAVAGLSMGGFGALSYAARHPGMFRAAASYSGVVHTQMEGAPQLLLGLTAGYGLNPLALWGDPVAHAAIWSAHNPSALAEQLRHTRVFLSSGNGRPGPLDPIGTPPDPLEGALFAQNAAFAQRLVTSGIQVTADFYGNGTHSWPYWERELRRSLPMLLDPLDNASFFVALRSEVASYQSAGRISDHLAVSLDDRLAVAARLSAGGSETRTIGYLEQFLARVENQLRRDPEARAALVAEARALIAYLLQDEEVEARKSSRIGVGH